MTLAIGLLSGGLDSAVALEVVKRAGIDVLVVHCLTGFSPLREPRGPRFSRPRTGSRDENPGGAGPEGPIGDGDEPPAVVRIAEDAGAEIRMIDVAEELLKIVKQPRYGRGSGMNPCIDCHAMMLRRAGEVMRAGRAAFVFTGDVLGQRPMSQNRQALGLIERASGLEGYILRPLSGKLLPPTEAEKAGLLDREMLLDIRGRSRKQQMELAGKWGIKHYLSPAGGCLLTDPAFSHRLRKLLEHNPEADLNDVQLLKAGRHFRLDAQTRAVVGRNEADNARLEALIRPGDIAIEAADMPGPLTVLRGNATEENLNRASGLTLRYAGAEAGREHRCRIRSLSDAAPETVREAEPVIDNEARCWMITPEKPENLSMENLERRK